MIRDLRVSDMPRQILPGGLSGEDWAYTRAALTVASRRINSLDLLRWSVSSSRSQHAFVCIESGCIVAVAVLQPRRGPRAWNVAHLVTSSAGLSHAGALLDRCVGGVAQVGGEHLFLRVLFRSPMQDLARKAGFMPAYTEEVFTLARPMDLDEDGEVLALRPALPLDDHELFRLYNAAVPANARAMLGLTMDQWRDAAEDTAGSAREYVWEEAGRLRAWARLSQHRDVLEVDALLHPEHGGQARPLTAAVARLARAHTTAAWTVPSYQPALSLTLQRRGLELSQTYTVLARSAANRVREPALMPVQA